jgi:large subunit ribosomal protein L2
LDLYRRINKYGFLLNIYYDPNRTGKIGLVLYENGLSSHILLQKNVKISDTIYSGSVFEKKIKQGYSLPLKLMPLFSVLSNIERKPFYGGNICKAAGVGSLLISKEFNKKKCVLKLNSG